MPDTTADSPADTIARYLRFWNAPCDEQEQLGAGVFTDDVAYVAPIGVRTGVAELVSFAKQFRDGAGAYELVTRTGPEIHHDRARLGWELVVGGTSLAEGTDVLVLDASGRVASITTFLDRAPEGFDPHAHADEAA